MKLEKTAALMKEKAGNQIFYDCGIVEAMRAEIHSAIYDDLKAEGLL